MLGFQRSSHKKIEWDRRVPTTGGGHNKNRLEGASQVRIPSFRMTSWAQGSRAGSRAGQLDQRGAWLLLMPEMRIIAQTGVIWAACPNLEPCCSRGSETAESAHRRHTDSLTQSLRS